MTEQQRRRPAARRVVARPGARTWTRITVPALICGSFSDNNLHSRGSFRGWERIASTERFLYTHRGGKWATFYSAEARADAAAVLRPLPARAATSRRRRGCGSRSARAATSIAERARRGRLAAGTHRMDPAVPDRRRAGRHAAAGGRADHLRHAHARARASTGPVPADTELTGPMALRLFVEAHGADDVDLFAGVEKWRGAQVRPVRGLVRVRPRPRHHRMAEGLAARARRGQLPARSSPCPLQPPSAARAGQVVPVDIALGPSATLFRAGETLRLVVAGRWLWPRNPLTGQFPAAYQKVPAAAAPCTGAPAARPGCSSRSSPDPRRAPGRITLRGRRDVIRRLA